MNQEVYQRALLVILDGWGHGKIPEVSAIAQANTPFIDSLYKNHPNSELITFGEDVGLPTGQMGNSEVGHLNIGAGRIVYQELTRINLEIKNKTFHTNKVLLESLQYAQQKGKKVHLIGLVSDGGVHSHINHLKALCDITSDFGLEDVFIHAFMDGRDTSPTSGCNYLDDLLNHIKDLPVDLASIIGRYYAMDRDKRWERIQLAYDLLVHGKGEKIKDPLQAIKASYKKGNSFTDEFLPPLVLTDENNHIKTTIEEEDVVIFFNFRTDRPRQITEVLSQRDIPEFNMKKLNLKYVTMTSYDDSYSGVDVIFEKDNLYNTLGEILAKEGKTQVRIAETEKYPHVTFFFSGGREESFKNEKRILIPSPKVPTYDFQPEMSAIEITNAITSYIEEELPDFICLNFANTDMVGHTGVFDAAIKAAEIVDVCVEQLILKAREHNYSSIIIADHGNSDFMINEDGSPHTAHTTNLVPCFYIQANKNNKNVALKNGKLADIAPTILDIMNLPIPKEMTGNSLIEKNEIN